MSAHTPGPWAVRGLDVFASNASSGSRRLVAMVPKDHEGEADENDARLIAASPDLLAALESLVAVLSQESYEPEDLDLEAVAALIRKARGTP